MDKRLASLARTIDHSLLHPTLTDSQLEAGCRFARENGLACVSIKSCAVPLAREILAGSEVAVGGVVGFPHGSSRTAVKVREAELACEDGATELDAVVNVGKVLSRDWDYVSGEIASLQQTAREGGALLKVIFENDYLPEDSYKVRLCELCTLHGVAFAKTSTGYGFVRRSDGAYSYRGATDHDLELMRRVCGPEVRIKAAGGVRTLDDLLRVLGLGADRVGLSATAEILAEARKRGFN
jgi:deoxyribose-phosphate aldolase